MRAIIALGANLDEPAQNVELAISILDQSTDLVERSSLYKTKPVGGPEQPDYVNAVCIVETQLPPHDLLHVLQGIEKSMGRVRDVKWGPRVIDCDLIAYDDFILDDEELTLPHPRAHERRFVLEPWLEIDPTAVLTGHGPVSAILAQLPLAE
ncbi:MAG: 2-amino-4-hydroxy-6-hydroxymethyldihydropteridine diphosphokinase [Actinobacteria bacterium]|nr:2-amino-4-hydroxy-6-hydroxymethyldihydropteridine diphosphokinase [Actinomycetota bacterium]